MKNLNESFHGDTLVGGVAFNAKLPMTCSMRPVGPDQCSPRELDEKNWQLKLVDASPYIPVLQDSEELNAWNEGFGVGHDDLMVYLDGLVYRYLPDEKNTINLDLLDDRYISAKLTNATDFDRVRNLIIDAYDLYPTSNSYKDYCNPSAVQTVAKSHASKVSSSDQNYASKDSKSPLYHVLLGFSFSVFILCCIVLTYNCVRKFIFPMLKIRLKSRMGSATNGTFSALIQTTDDIIDDVFEGQIEMKTKEKDEGPDPRSIHIKRSRSFDDDNEMSMFVNDRRESLDINEMEKQIAINFEKSIFI